MNAIEIKNLKKYYGEVKAVDDVSFSVKQGEFFAFLGVNGAGKSTTISVLCGRQKRDGGEVLVEGKEIDSCGEESRRAIGVVFQSSALDSPLTVGDNLRYRAALYGITGQAYRNRLEELVSLFDLAPLLCVILSIKIKF